MRSLLFLLSFCVSCASAALTIPSFSEPVVDKAGMIPPSSHSFLNNNLKKLYLSGGSQIAVLTVPSLEGETIEDYAVKVFENWQLGQKGKDNGVLLLVSKKERKLRIEVGYGLEGQIPDAYAKRIIENFILPQFRKGDFSGGIALGVQQIINLSRGDSSQISTVSSSGENDLQSALLVLLFGLGLFIGTLGLLIRLGGGVPRAGGSHGFPLRGGRHRHSGYGGWGGGLGGGGGWGGGGGGRSGGGGASGGW